MKQEHNKRAKQQFFLKKLNIILFITSLFFVSTSSAKIGITYFSYSNVLNDYSFYLESGFPLGSGGACPRVTWVEIKKSNDTVYIDAIYNIRGLWPLMGCASRDTIKYTNTFIGVNYFTIASGEIHGPTLTPEKDTVLKQFDTTFYVGTSSIKEQNGVKSISIFPNPTQQTICLSVAASELIFYNSFGQIVLKANDVPAQQPVDLLQLNNGLYFIAAFDKEKNKIGAGKFFKE